MLVTFRFKENTVLYCGDIHELDYKIEDNKLAIYKDSELLGYYETVIGISEEEFLDFVKNYIIEKNIEVK